DVAGRSPGAGPAAVPLHLARPAGGGGAPRRAGIVGSQSAFRLRAGPAQRWRAGDRAGLPRLSGGSNPRPPATLGGCPATGGGRRDGRDGAGAGGRSSGGLHPADAGGTRRTSGAGTSASRPAGCAALARNSAAGGGDRTGAAGPAGATAGGSAGTEGP